MTDAELPRDRVNDDLPREVVLRVASATKRFGGVAAVDNVDLDVRDGEFLCLLGPSGCGKTTLLRVMAGFENPTAGRILLDGRDITSDPPHRRPLNMMFQSYALFPHLSVANNIAFGLKRDGMPAAEIARRVAEMLALVRLDGYGARKPHQLSGGQRQRVALARALAKRPRVLLLDEPMAALDRKLREETQIELKTLQADLGLTFITVTHDQTEALTMADRIAVMHAGKIAQIGAPRDIYQRPANLTVARFIGDISMFDGVARAGEAAGETLFDCAAPAMTFTIAAKADPDRFACRHAAVRPENIKLYPWRPSDQPNVMQGTIVQSLYRGEARLLIVDVEGVPVRVMQSNAIGADNELAIGAAVWLSIPPDALILLRD